MGPLLYTPPGWWYLWCAPPRPPGPRPSFGLRRRNPRGRGLPWAPRSPSHPQAVLFCRLSCGENSPNSKLTPGEPRWQTRLNIYERFSLLPEPEPRRRWPRRSLGRFPGPGAPAATAAGRRRTPLQLLNYRSQGASRTPAPSLSFSLPVHPLLPGPCCFGWRRSGGVSEKVWVETGAGPIVGRGGGKGGRGSPEREGSGPRVPRLRICREPGWGRRCRGSAGGRDSGLHPRSRAAEQRGASILRRSPPAPAAAAPRSAAAPGPALRPPPAGPSRRPLPSPLPGRAGK